MVSSFDFFEVLTLSVSALKGKRDAVGIRQHSNDQDSLESLSDHSPPASSSFYHSNADLLKLITQLTEDDINLRKRKSDRFRSMTEAMKLLREVNKNAVYPGYFGRDDLRLVDVIDMACVTSGDMHSLVEWSQTLPFFKQLPVECRTSLLRRFAVHQLVVEAGYYTANSHLDDMWLFPNGTCMPRDMKYLPPEKQVRSFG
jgi:hypothetical protein